MVSFVGAYSGTSVRQRVSEKSGKKLISLTDLHRANEEPYKQRADRFIRYKETQLRLKELSKGVSSKDIVLNASGSITQIFGELEVIRGGAREDQGTFANTDIALFYASCISDDCYFWLNSVLKSDGTTLESDEVVYAKSASIELGSKSMSVFELPNGSYVLSQTEVTKIAEKEPISFLDFLKSNSPEALPYKGYKFKKIKYSGSKGGRPPNAVPIPLAAAYWTKESLAGNPVTCRLLGAAMVESIERRADKAFGKVISEEEYNRRFNRNFANLIASYPETFMFLEKKSELRVSVYEEVKKNIKKRYPLGVIKGIKDKVSLKKEIVYLSSQSPIDFWKMIPSQELTYELGNLIRAKYPDAMTKVIPLQGRNQSIVFVFQFFDSIVDYQDVEECALKRRYVQIAKEALKVDYAFLFLVSPLGATPAAYSFIQNNLPDGENGCFGSVGILTVKQLAQFYHSQIIANKQTSAGKGRVTKEFKKFLDYENRTNPLEALTDSQYKQLTIFDMKN